MAVKTKEKTIDRFQNIAHYESEKIKDLKNLNEVYRYVLFKDKKYHIAENRAEFIYIDLTVDDIEERSDIWKFFQQTSESYKFIKRFRCTGIKDKTGALIFEGDIVEYKCGSEKVTACVTFINGGTGWNKGCSSVDSYQKYTVIISDILQNPKLDWRAKEHMEEFGIKDYRKI